MKFKATCLIALCALGLTGLARADSRSRVITITTDAFPGNFSIDVMRDSSGALTKMFYQTPNNPNGVLTLDQMHQGPQLIFHSQGHDVILMSVENDFDPMNGGHVDVRYLHNGVDGSYKDFRVHLSLGSQIVLTCDPDMSDPDSDGNACSGPFNRLFMEKNTVFGMTVGIDDLVPSYQQ